MRRAIEQYEISNVARPGRRSRHNLKYWQDGEWMGVGPGRALHPARRALANEASSSRSYLDSVDSGTAPRTWSGAR